MSFGAALGRHDVSPEEKWDEVSDLRSRETSERVAYAASAVCCAVVRWVLRVRRRVRLPGRGKSNVLGGSRHH